MDINQDLDQWIADLENRQNRGEIDIQQEREYWNNLFDPEGEPMGYSGRSLRREDTIDEVVQAGRQRATSRTTLQGDESTRSFDPDQEMWSPDVSPLGDGIPEGHLNLPDNFNRPLTEEERQRIQDRRDDAIARLLENQWNRERPMYGPPEMPEGWVRPAAQPGEPMVARPFLAPQRVQAIFSAVAEQGRWLAGVRKRNREAQRYGYSRR